MSAYCTRGDLYDSGLPRGALPNPGRVVASVDVANDLMTLEGHGLETDDVVVFRAEAGGTLPSPLVAGVSYYAIAVTDSTFKVSATEGGSAIDLTSAGSSVVAVTQLPFDRAIVWASAIVDNFLPSHVVPLEAPYPEIVVQVVADLAIARLSRQTGGASSDFVTAKLAEAQRILDRWGKQLAPIRGENAPTAANLAVTGVGSTDPRGWATEVGKLP